MEMLMASHFLDIPNLVEIACKMVASHIDGLSFFILRENVLLSYIVNMSTPPKNL
jgi:hypothetical protein